MVTIEFPAGSFPSESTNPDQASYNDDLNILREIKYPQFFFPEEIFESELLLNRRIFQVKEPAVIQYNKTMNVF